MPFDLAAYLKRVNHGETLRPDLATLTALHRAHVKAVPFEGLDPFLRRPVSLDLDALQEKIVGGRRGGYCFEVNALFQHALEAIGFAVTPLAGRVAWNAPPDAPLGPRTHMLLKVETEAGPHIADVGFGGCLLDEPLPLRMDAGHETRLGVYRMISHGGRIALAAQRGSGWRTLYHFDLEPQLPADYELANFYTATSGRPPFARFVTVERIDGDRRLRLIDRRHVIEGRDGIVRSERRIEDAAELERVLVKDFGIVPPVSADDIFARIGE